MILLIVYISFQIIAYHSISRYVSVRNIWDLDLFVWRLQGNGKCKLFWSYGWRTPCCCSSNCSTCHRRYGWGSCCELCASPIGGQLRGSSQAILWAAAVLTVALADPGCLWGLSVVAAGHFPGSRWHLVFGQAPFQSSRFISGLCLPDPFVHSCVHAWLHQCLHAQAAAGQWSCKVLVPGVFEGWVPDSNRASACAGAWSRLRTFWHWQSRQQSPVLFFGFFERLRQDINFALCASSREVFGTAWVPRWSFEDLHGLCDKDLGPLCGSPVPHWRSSSEHEVVSPRKPAPRQQLDPVLLHHQELAGEMWSQWFLYLCEEMEPDVFKAISNLREKSHGFEISFGPSAGECAQLDLGPCQWVWVGQEPLVRWFLGCEKDVPSFSIRLSKEVMAAPYEDLHGVNGAVREALAGQFLQEVCLLAQKSWLPNSWGGVPACSCRLAPWPGASEPGPHWSSQAGGGLVFELCSRRWPCRFGGPRSSFGQVRELWPSPWLPNFEEAVWPAKLLQTGLQLCPRGSLPASG